MELLVPGVVFVAGIGIYLAYFQRGEHHLHPQRNIQIFLATTTLYILVSHQVYNTAFPQAITSCLSISAFFFTGLFSSLSIYRLFLNPLNAIPGPYCARLTKFSTVFRNRKLDSYRQLQRLHGKYGDFVRIGPNDISVTDPEGVQVIFGAQTRCGKSAWYDGEHPLHSIHQTRDKREHDQRRKIWAPAFSDKALRGYEGRIDVYNDLLIKQIKAQSGKAIDVSKWFNYYSFDVMGDLGFGSPFNMLDKGEKHWAIQLLNDGIAPLGFNFPIWFFRILLLIPFLTAAHHRFLAFCGQQIEERVKRQGDGENDARDVASFLVDGYAKMGEWDGEGKRMRLWADSLLIVIAGSDTTAATLAFLFYYLASDQDVLRKLGNELGGLAKDGSLTLRLHPPVPSGVFRETPREGVVIGETFVPGNTTIQMPGYVMARKESIYPSATSFIPERWSTKPELIKHKDAFQPFASGWGGCIGKNLALMELRTLVARLVMGFDVVLAEGKDGRPLLEGSTDHFTIGLGNLRVVFTERMG